MVSHQPVIFITEFIDELIIGFFSVETLLLPNSLILTMMMVLK